MRHASSSGILSRRHEARRRLAALALGLGHDFGFCSACSMRALRSAGLTLAGLSQVSTVACVARVSVSLPSGGLAVIVEPAPIVAPSPMHTGATSMLPEPMKAPSPMTVGHLFVPS